MREMLCSAVAVSVQYLLEGFLQRRQKCDRYIITFFLMWFSLMGVTALYGYDDVVCERDRIFICEIDIDCMTPQQRRDITIKALEHRREAVRSFKNAEWYAKQMSLLNEDTPKELMAAAIAGLCTRPYQWSSVVNALIVYAYEHSWNLIQLWKEIETEINKGQYHVEMFEFYKFILDNG